jgi:hypothetical protein
MDEGEEVGSELVVSGANASEILQFVEEALDAVPLSVERFLPAVFRFAIGAVRNIGNGTLSPDAGPHAVGVIALVGQDDGARFEPVEQSLGRSDVVIVAWRDQQLDRPALGVDARVDFRREPASASTDTTNSTLFLTPEAC